MTPPKVLTEIPYSQNEKYYKVGSPLSYQCRFPDVKGLSMHQTDKHLYNSEHFWKAWIPTQLWDWRLNACRQGRGFVIGILIGVKSHLHLHADFPSNSWSFFASKISSSTNRPVSFTVPSTRWYRTNAGTLWTFQSTLKVLSSFFHLCLTISFWEHLYQLRYRVRRWRLKGYTRRTRVVALLPPKRPQVHRRQRQRGYAAMRLGHRDTMTDSLPDHLTRWSREKDWLYCLRVRWGRRVSLAAWRWWKAASWWIWGVKVFDVSVDRWWWWWRPRSVFISIIGNNLWKWRMEFSWLNDATFGKNVVLSFWGEMWGLLEIIVRAEEFHKKLQLPPLLTISI